MNKWTQQHWLAPRFGHLHFSATLRLHAPMWSDWELHTLCAPAAVSPLLQQRAWLSRCRPQGTCRQAYWRRTPGRTAGHLPMGTSWALTRNSDIYTGMKRHQTRMSQSPRQKHTHWHWCFTHKAQTLKPPWARQTRIHKAQGATRGVCQHF